VRQFNPHNQITRYLTADEEARLLEAAAQISRTLYEMLVVTLCTGLRKGNCVRLERAALSVERGALTFRQKRGTLHMVPLPATVVQLLQEIPPNGTPWFWVNPRTSLPYSVDWRKPWHAARELAGLDPAFRWHDLRHAAGTALYLATGDIRVAKEILGHSELKTTMRYAHATPEHLRGAVEIIAPKRLIERPTDSVRSRSPTKPPTSDENPE
jgi:integrase